MTVLSARPTPGAFSSAWSETAQLEAHQPHRDWLGLRKGMRWHAQGPSAPLCSSSQCVMSKSSAIQDTNHVSYRHKSNQIKSCDQKRSDQIEPKNAVSPFPHHLAPQQLEASHTNGVLACAHRQHKTPSKAKPNVNTARLILTCEHHVGAGTCAGTRPSPVALCCKNRRIRSRTIEGAAGAALARDDAEVRELELEVQRRGASPGTTTRNVRPRGGALGVS